MEIIVFSLLNIYHRLLFRRKVHVIIVFRYSDQNLNNLRFYRVNTILKNSREGGGEDKYAILQTQVYQNLCYAARTRNKTTDM